MNSPDTVQLVQLEQDLAAVVGCERLHVVLASRLSVPVRCGFLGCYAIHLSSWLHNEIGDHFEGNGPTVFVNDDLLRATFPAGESLIPTIACHEATHAVCSGWSSLGVDPAYAVAFHELLGTTPTQLAAVTTSPDQRQFALHGPHFLRLLCHVGHRMTSRGWEIDFLRLHDWQGYGLPSPIRLRDVINGELMELADVPLGAIAGIDPPIGWEEITTPRFYRGRLSQFTQRLLTTCEDDATIVSTSETRQNASLASQTQGTPHSTFGSSTGGWGRRAVPPPRISRR